MENKELEATIYKDLKKDYDGVEKIVMENEAEFGPSKK